MPSTFTRKLNTRPLLALASGVVLMFGLGLTIVPIYNLAYKTLSLPGKSISSVHKPLKITENKHSATTQLSTDARTKLHADASANSDKLDIYPGKNKIIDYYTNHEGLVDTKS